MKGVKQFDEVPALPQLEAHGRRVAESQPMTPVANDVSRDEVMCASADDIERIRQLVLATYREIRSIVEHTEREEAVALFNLQLIHFDD